MPERNLVANHHQQCEDEDAPHHGGDQDERQPVEQAEILDRAQNRGATRSHELPGCGEDPVPRFPVDGSSSVVNLGAPGVEALGQLQRFQSAAVVALFDHSIGLGDQRPGEVVDTPDTLFDTEGADQPGLLDGVGVPSIRQQRLALEPQRFEARLESVVIEAPPRTGDVLVTFWRAIRRLYWSVGGRWRLGWAEANDATVRLCHDDGLRCDEHRQQQRTTQYSTRSTQSSSPGRSGPLRFFSCPGSSADRSGNRGYSLG